VSFWLPLHSLKLSSISFHYCFVQTLFVPHDHQLVTIRCQICSRK